MSSNIPWELIDRAFRASISAYEDEWQITIDGSGSSATATITQFDGGIILAFKGSAEVVDWIINASAIPRYYSGAWVHWGFACAHKSIWTEVMNELIRQGGKRLIVTGHSLGGALAELSMLKLKSYPGKVSLITFGKPNVFLKPQTSRFTKLEHQISVVSGNDLVARIPKFAYGPDLGQKMLFLGDNKNYWFDQIAEKERAIIKDETDLTKLFSDHFRTTYQSKLRLRI